MVLFLVYKVKKKERKKNNLSRGAQWLMVARIRLSAFWMWCVLFHKIIPSSIQYGASLDYG